MELIEEGMGESSSPPRWIAGQDPSYDIKNDIYLRLVESKNLEAIENPNLRDLLDAHFSRLPASYVVDINVDRAEDVMLHWKLLAAAKAGKRPAFHVRFMKLEESNSDAGMTIDDKEEGRFTIDAVSARDDGRYTSIHEIIISTVDKPKTLSRLSALLSDLGLNIREAHVFSTTDGYSLDVFVVDGWPAGETDALQEKLKAEILIHEGSLSGSSVHAIQYISSDWEIDRRLLKMGEKIGCGSSGDLYRGSYLDQDVAIKILRSEHLNETMRVEFAQELMILREVQHKNVVRFVGACSNPQHFCIVTAQPPPRRRRRPRRRFAAAVIVVAVVVAAVAAVAVIAIVTAVAAVPAIVVASPPRHARCLRRVSPSPCSSPSLLSSPPSS